MVAHALEPAGPDLAELPFPPGAAGGAGRLVPAPEWGSIDGGNRTEEEDS
jgi:hypothetical protein